MASVFLVEDEVLIRMMVAEMVTELGHTDLPSALKHANDAAFDLAVLDVQLGRHSIAPVAKVLAHRNIPLAFATGYGADGGSEEFRERPWLQKPFQIDQLERCIAQLLP